MGSPSPDENNDAPLSRTEYTLRAEVAGGLGPQSVLDSSTNPPAVSVLHYDFVSWLGDDIVASFPCSIVTEALAKAIADEGLTGAQIDEVIVTKNPQFEHFFPDIAALLPEWKWLRPTGQPHDSDFWQDEQGILIVSDRALNLLRKFSLENCRIGTYGDSAFA
ncbi:MAG TPA: hypothetical protein VFH00_11315 [Candidatus Nitrosotalea sp.]|nr:hypothetical protein [Candidatus Nitrosotalea sp.]